MGTLDVSCAVIERGGTVLLAQRSAAMALPLRWEFPGGKRHPGESAAACLEREIGEELGVAIRILRALPPSRSPRAGGELVLHPFVCEIAAGTPEPREHRELRWVTPEEAAGYDLAAPDVPVLAAYRRLCGPRGDAP
jgi:8-oxo-dGTP diphosphatase